MAYTSSYSPESLTRADVDTSAGPLVLEFGTNWCGVCRGAQPIIEEALSGLDGVPHIKVEDGPGRPLGRSFKVKLWPTLVFLHDGQIKAQLVRPTDAQALKDAAQLITSA